MARKKKKPVKTKRAPSQQVTSYNDLIVKKTINRTRKDITDWNNAIRMTRLEQNPKWYMLHQLYNEITLDTLLDSQYENRNLKAVTEPIVLYKPNGEVDQEQTDLLNNANFTSEINQHILDSQFYGSSVVEFQLNDSNELLVDLINRQNIDPDSGLFYPDYSLDKNIIYRDMREYGTWLLEFGKKGDLGKFNKAVPYVLFKRFALSAWSELGEIYGIPPRYMKTNTQDPTMVRRAESMMRDMGSAAWFIIDESEQFEFADGVATDGSVYDNLINRCNNEISMLISGAVIGQDTKNGNRSKEESSKELLNTKIVSDLRLLAKEWNTKVIPALQRLGILKGDVTYGYEKAEDLETLWKMTHESMQHFDVKPEWIKEKFGIEVEAKKAIEAPKGNNLNLDANFFV